MEIALRGHLNTLMPKQGIELGTFCSRERCLNHSATDVNGYMKDFEDGT